MKLFENNNIPQPVQNNAQQSTPANNIQTTVQNNNPTNSRPPSQSKLANTQNNSTNITRSQNQQTGFVPNNQNNAGNSQQQRQNNMNNNRNEQREAPTNVPTSESVLYYAFMEFCMNEGIQLNSDQISQAKEIFNEEIDNSKFDTNNVGEAFIIPTGLISGNNIIDNNVRSVFASMNYNELEITNDIAFAKHALTSLYPNNFN